MSARSAAISAAPIPAPATFPAAAAGLLHYLLVTLGLWGTVKDDVIAPSRYHRLLRRGRPYGKPGAEQGLHFIALSSNLTRHFEFIQNAWLMNPELRRALAGSRSADRQPRALSRRRSDRQFHPPAGGGALHPLHRPPPLRHRRGRRLFLPAGAEGAEVHRSGVTTSSVIARERSDEGIQSTGA